MKKYQRNHAGQQFLCKECGNQFIGRKSLNDHMTKHIQQTNEVNVVNSGTQGNLKEHITGHHRVGKNGCDECRKSFQFHTSFLNHNNSLLTF